LACCLIWITIEFWRPCQLTCQCPSIYSTSELLSSYRRFLGQDVSVNDLYKISQAITARYQADGYGETSAVVPSQLIRSGVVTIRIEEGFVGNVILVN